MNHKIIQSALATYGFDSPITVLHFDVFDQMAEAITRWFMAIGKPFTVVIGDV